MFKEWIDESYRAQAPKTLLEQLGALEEKLKKTRAAKKKRRAWHGSRSRL